MPTLRIDLQEGFGGDEVLMEVDVCQSVNPAAGSAPLLPSYDTGTHPNRPADLPRRQLTIQEAYREAGVKKAASKKKAAKKKAAKKRGQ
ncbi:MAG TPA: hypothetical protein VF544_13190 [Pyrinomonadaceae bacterium]|jgi:hypothetical protein